LGRVVRHRAVRVYAELLLLRAALLEDPAILLIRCSYGRRRERTGNSN